MPGKRRVALVTQLSMNLIYEFVRGVADYARAHGPWVLYTPLPNRGLATFGSLERWRGHGVIADVYSDRVAARVRATGLPVVNVAARRRYPEFPLVASDDRLIGRLAAEHLLERGFRRFAYLGRPRHWYSARRREGFESAVREAGYECEAYEPVAPRGRRRSWEAEQAELARWVATLQTPVGLMACADDLARRAADACQDLGLTVPDAVALVGVDNEELICEFSDPPLSSVGRASRRLGYEAAALLDRLMAGRRAPTQPVLVPPLGVITRRSTDILAIEDEAVARAVRYIHEHAADGIGVDDVVKAAPLSRRSLERRFRDALRRSPGEEIRRVRLTLAKKLLAETDLPVYEVAARAGFAEPGRFSYVFRTATGLSPREHRRRVRKPRA